MNKFFLPLRTLRHAIALLTDALLPGICALCGSGLNNHPRQKITSYKLLTHALCSACVTKHVIRPVVRCRCCSISLPGLITDGQRCGTCLSDPPAFDATVVATDYAPPLDSLIQDLKFRARLPLAHAFGRLLIEAAPACALSADLIIAVPLASARLSDRGFNQAQEIARPLAHAWRLPLRTDVCLRIKDTDAQAGLSLAQRRVNMRGAFAIQNLHAVSGKHLLVVDDVMTTGNTLNELAACLKRHGALRVTNMVVARTPVR